MSFDSSRFTFDPWQNFSGVVMPQGRVQLDSDSNESLAEFTRRIQAGTLDIVGQAGVPSSTPNGFAIAITSVSGKPSISIGQGRIYVDGILAENHGTPAPNPEKWTPAADATPESQYPGWDGALDELVGPNPVDYNSQPYYPNSPPFPATGGPYLIYVDVWQREVTFLEDADLIEKAVGVDTTGRMQTVWQVKWLNPGSASVTCTTDIPGWDNLLLPPGPRLTTGVAQSSPSGPCCLTSNSGYTGLENQLYRVEIHQPGALSPGVATFKWSRDNASVATNVLGIDSTKTVLMVQSTGKDSVLRFSPGDWVEITDDWLELNGLKGELHLVTFVDDTAKTVTLGTALTGTFDVNASPSRHTRLIRWDQKGQVLESPSGTVWADLTLPGSPGDIPVPPAGTTLLLENGITIAFNQIAGGSQFNTGHAWTFAARTADGTVEYLDNVPPRSIYHHYARLALVTLPSTVTPCRIVFPPLTGLQEGGCCCCSVTVGDGVTSHGGFTDIQQAINSLTPGPGPFEVCLLPGTYSPSATINVTLSNLTIRGCSQAQVRFSGADPVFHVTSAGQITFDTVNVLASSTAIEVTLGTQISIVNCSFTLEKPFSSGFCVIAQAAGLTASSNQMSGGGIWVLDGSSQIQILDNIISNAGGPGIGLGGLPSGTNPAPAATGVIYTEIADNRITAASNSGVTTVFGETAGAAALGDVEDLLIENNLIAGCALSRPTLPYSTLAVAGILLQNCINATIRENIVSNNGTPNGIPACGVYMENVSDIEIADNQIVDDGVAPGAEGSGLQVGIYGFVTRFTATDSLRIRDNRVRMSAGPALKVEGVGPMSITGNTLESFGVWPANSRVGLAVYIINFGLPLEVGEVSLSPLQRATAQVTPSPPGAKPDLSLKDGRTSFDSNKVTFVPNPTPKGPNIPCVILTLDDLSVQDNQFEATIIDANALILAHTMAFGLFTLRVIGNRFSEFPYTAFYSHIGYGNWNIIDRNQATHCVQAVGGNPITGATNQVIITAFCQDAARNLKA